MLEMLRPLLAAFAAATLCLAPVAAHGQEPEPSRLTQLGEEGLVVLTLAWRYHPGDDPRWADPAFDDTGWETVEPQMPAGKLPRQGWPGTGWFRRHLRVNPSLWGKPLVVRVATPGATAVFLDGAPLLDTAALGVAPSGGAWREVVLSPRPDHVLAVRHAIPPAVRDARGNSGFLLSIEAPDTAELQAAAEERRSTRLSFFTLVPAFLAACLGLLHLALFLFYPKARENLFYALTMAGFTAILVSDLGTQPAASEVWGPLAYRSIIASALATIFFALLTYYSVRTSTFPRTWIAFGVVGAALIAWTFLDPEPPPLWIWYAYFGLQVAEVIRVEVFGRPVEREGIKVLLYGFAIAVIFILLQILVQLDLLRPAISIPPHLVAMLVFAVSMSIFLARSFGRTHLHGGRPIGSRLSGAWSEHTAPLAPGDTLLFASDGFAEQLDPAGQPLGYEALAEALRAAAGAPAGEIAERLLARVAAWRGTREQGDDITFVVVRVK